MSDDLVKRLRWKAGAYAKEAANRIEQLAATVEKLEEKNSRLKLDLLLANDVADAAIEGKKELEAKLAKAVEALVRIADTPSEMTWGVDSEVREAMNGMEIIAETALAELTGGNDE